MVKFDERPHERAWWRTVYPCSYHIVKKLRDETTAYMNTTYIVFVTALTFTNDGFSRSEIVVVSPFT